MTSAPSGTVTVLFTDLVGSTPLRAKLGDDELERLRRGHFRLLREALGAHRGQEVKTLGDGVMAVFASALDALDCAVAMQQAVHDHNRELEDDQRLEVRIGLDVGEPIREEEDYFGTPVVVAKRLCDSAQGGQVMVSELVRRLIGSRREHTFRKIDSLKLKGIADQVIAYEAVWQLAAIRPVAGPRAREEAALCPLPHLLIGGERTAFVGRGRELDSLDAAWEGARADQRRLVVLSGEPGIGKTRLAAEFAARAHGAGATVLYGRSEEEPLATCQPFVEAFRFYVSAGLPGPLRERAVRIAEELAKPAPEGPSDEEHERYRLFEEVASWLTSASEPHPLLLILDDLQWADKPTLALLKQIVRSPSASTEGPLFMLGTYRSTDLAPQHPLLQLLAELRRSRAFERITLPGLSEGDVTALVGAWIGQEAPPGFIQAVYDQTEGNPFFIEEVLRHLAESGLIQQPDGRLPVDLALAQMAIPEGVKEVIGRRLSRLSDDCNSVLTIASVIGRDFGLDALERASNLSGDRLLELLEEGVAAKVISEVPHTVGYYSFAHALIYETLYEELTTTRRVRLHGQTLQYADNNGVKLAYEVLGASGPYLIAVGISNCPAVRTRYRATALRWERMTRICRLILYDRRGVGFSAAPERGYSLLASVEDLRAVLDAAGAERAVLWGAADGGPLAIAFAVHHPERVAGLLLLGTTAKYTSSEDFPCGVNPAVMESFLRLDPVDQGRAVSQITRTRPGTGAGAEAISEVMTRVPRRVWSKVVGGIGAADARSLLAQVRVPTLIVHDPGNEYIPVAGAHYLHEHIPGSKLEITEEYGALLFGETLYRTLETFIEEEAIPSWP